MSNPQNFNSFSFDQKVSQPANPALSRYMANVFTWMFLALSVSTLFAWIFTANETLQTSLYAIQSTPRGMARTLTGLGWIVMFAPIGFVMLMSFGFQRMSYMAMVVCFMLYSAINGISFSFILLFYTANSVITCFASAAALFGIMAVMGYNTKQDLTSFGRIMTIGLIGMVIAMLINVFMRSPAMSYVISAVGVAVFTGLTAYDVQKIKGIGAGVNNGTVSTADGKKLGIYGALTLYLDFINLFLMLLRLFGNRRD
jgi:FtsH-binding integral membrane protein